jgi:SSS family solute:Na+ symporter
VFAPSGIRGIILAGFVAAVMSAMSALANAVATIFSLDVYRRFVRKQASDSELIATGRIAAGTALVIAALIAPSISKVGLFRYFQTGITYMATPFISVVLLGILWKRTSYAGAIAGLVGGLGIQITLAAALWAGGATLHWLYVGAIAQLLTMLLIAFVSLLTNPPAPEQFAPFLWSLSCLDSYKSGDTALPWWQEPRFWFAIYALGWCYVYWRFW